MYISWDSPLWWPAWQLVIFSHMYVSKPGWAALPLLRARFARTTLLRYVGNFRPRNLGPPFTKSWIRTYTGCMLDSIGIPPASHSNALTTRAPAIGFYILYFLKVYNLQYWVRNLKCYHSQFHAIEMYFGGLPVLVWTMVPRNYLNTIVNS